LLVEQRSAAVVQSARPVGHERTNELTGEGTGRRVILIDERLACIGRGLRTTDVHVSVRPENEVERGMLRLGEDSQELTGRQAVRARRPFILEDLVRL